MKKNIITVLPYVFINASTTMVKAQDKEGDKIESPASILKKNK